MSFPIKTRATVLRKWESDFKCDDGRVLKYHNVKIVNTSTYDSQNVSVKEELYNKLKEDTEYIFSGGVGGSAKNQYWFFSDATESVKDK